MLITSAAVCSVPSAHIRICPILLILPAQVQNLIFRTLCSLFVFVDVSLFVGSDPSLLSAFFLRLLVFACVLSRLLRRTFWAVALFFLGSALVAFYFFVLFLALLFLLVSFVSVFRFSFFLLL